MSRLLQLIFLILMIRLVWNAVVRLLSGTEAKRVRDSTPRDRKTIYRGQMVRDPVCGVYIPEQGALVEQRGEQAYHFCSDECRDRFRQGLGKVAAK
jgi:YHS domain-containing protein